jgi:hypothetical protein
MRHDVSGCVKWSISASSIWYPKNRPVLPGCLWPIHVEVVYTRDGGWALHRRFYADMRRVLRPQANVVVQEAGGRFAGVAGTRWNLMDAPSTLAGYRWLGGVGSFQQPRGSLQRHLCRSESGQRLTEPTEPFHPESVMRHPQDARSVSDTVGWVLGCWHRRRLCSTHTTNTV